jgi:hypothetical protein
LEELALKPGQWRELGEAERGAVLER